MFRTFVRLFGYMLIVLAPPTVVMVISFLLSWLGLDDNAWGIALTSTVACGMLAVLAARAALQSRRRGQR